MSGTKKRPLARIPAPSISPQVLEMFRRISRLRCTCEPPPGGRTHVSVLKLCDACEAWWSGQSEIHDLLRLKPWIWPCLPRISRYFDRERGQMRRYGALDHQRELAARLREAARAQRRDMTQLRPDLATSLP
jgi:hypothetical protein